MLSIHNNLSAGAQNVTGYEIIMLVYGRLLTTRLHGKAAVLLQIMLKKHKSYLSKAIILKFKM